MNTYSEERSAPIDLRSLQLSSLKRLLSLNKNTSSDDLVNDDSYVWKILIFDHFCQESLSTIFKVGNLRDENITLHLNLHSQRDKIHGVNTIYYIQPTEANIDKLIEDFAKDLYDSVHINFSYPISNELLGKLSKGIAKYNAFYKLKQVFQHHLNYIASTTNLFDLDMPDVYASIRKPELRPQVIDAISHSIISVLMSLKMLPVITFQSGFAEEVAKRIDVI
jgi:Proteins involved in synaptic transmission and general secretion, Sec1 family